MRSIVRHLRSLLRLRRKKDRRSFELMFRRFREVLDNNNRTLEVITGMGDVLGGDYLFDIQYVRKAVDGLFQSLAGSLDAFDELTDRRYPELRVVARKIEERIRDAVEAAEPRTSSPVLFLEEITRDRAPVAGNKIARLAELRSDLGIAVPDGFVITTRAFDLFLRHNRIHEHLRSGAEHASLSSSQPEEAHELVLHGAIPPELSSAIQTAIDRLRSRCGENRFIAVRSSASEEDGDRSFAGQFRTVLNVPLERGEVERAYRKVLASLFTQKAAAYQERMGIPPGAVKMAVGCLLMTDAEVSGVLYTRDPGSADRMVVSAAWGLGPSVVEGGVDADRYVLSRDTTGALIEERTGIKERMIVPCATGGTDSIPVQPGRVRERCLDAVRLSELAQIARTIEAHSHAPQDIEWSIDRKGRIVILQSRPLAAIGSGGAGAVLTTDLQGSVLVRDRGLVVQKGAVSGRIFVVRNMQNLDDVPGGAVLVARHDSSDLIRVMPRIAAIITERGALTSHMASLSRELRVPTVVNAGDMTAILEPGKEVTLVAGDDGMAVYEGRLNEVLAAETARPSMDELFEYRRKRAILRPIAGLNLVDPLRDEFTPHACRTVHDVLRLMHERSVAELIEAAGHGLRPGRTVRLDLPIPAGLLVIDIGGGLEEGVHDAVRTEQVTSLPLRSVVAGMTRPGMWRSDAVPLSMGDFMTSMLRVPDIVVENADHVGSNIAIVSREYMNLSLKFGYHFTVVDCHAGEVARNNHLYFRFAGGATDITKRSRRLQVIEAILAGLGFSVSTRGDLLIARFMNAPRQEMLNVLDQVGRLLAYTRQLDAELSDESAVGRSIENFRREHSVV